VISRSRRSSFNSVEAQSLGHVALPFIFTTQHPSKHPPHLFCHQTGEDAEGRELILSPKKLVLPEYPLLDILPRDEGLVAGCIHFSAPLLFFLFTSWTRHPLG